MNLSIVYRTNIGIFIDSYGPHKYFDIKHLGFHPQKTKRWVCICFVNKFAFENLHKGLFIWRVLLNYKIVGTLLFEILFKYRLQSCYHISVSINFVDSQNLSRYAFLMVRLHYACISSPFFNIGNRRKATARLKSSSNTSSAWCEFHPALRKLPAADGSLVGICQA